MIHSLDSVHLLMRYGWYFFRLYLAAILDYKEYYITFPFFLARLSLNLILVLEFLEIILGL